MSDTIDKSARRVRAMFGQIARRYDLLNHVLSLGIDRAWRRRAVRLAAPEIPGPILDVCTGTADLALEYWRITDERRPIVGADFCRPMLRFGAEKLFRQGASHRVRLIEADATALPFRDGVFAVVSAAFGLRNVSDFRRGLAEMSRVCAPGGQVAVLEFSMPHRWPFSALYRFYFKHLLPRIGQSMARNQHAAYEYLPQTVQQFPQGEAFLQIMAESGLNDLRRYPFSGGISTLYLGRRPRCTMPTSCAWDSVLNTHPTDSRSRQSYG